MTGGPLLFALMSIAAVPSSFVAEQKETTDEMSGVVQVCTKIAHAHG